MSSGTGAGADRGERIRPRFLAKGRDLVVSDPIERRRITIDLDSAVAPSTVSTDRFRAPVDAAVAVDAGRLVFSQAVNLVVRDVDGEQVVRTGMFADETLPPAEYCVEVGTAVKLYVQLEGRLGVFSDADQTRIDVESDGPLLVGARSRHGRPAATITVGDSPRDVMAAVSAFGSASRRRAPNAPTRRSVVTCR
ncbi:MAG: hypothetical protein ABEJ42_09235 [Halobacteriaceae archaeon]